MACHQTARAHVARSLTCITELLHGREHERLTFAWAAAAAAVEGSSRMADVARSVLHENKLDESSGGPVTVISARMEDVASLPVPQVRESSQHVPL